MNLSKASAMLEEASSLVSDSLDFVPRDTAGYLPVKQAMLATKVMSDILDMQGILWNLEPDLVPGYIRPSFDHGDLTTAIKGLAFGHDIQEEQGIIVMKRHMPNDELDKFMSEETISGKYKFAKAWWEKQEKPFIPRYRMARFLSHDDLYMRYHAAKQIEGRYGIVI